MVDCVGRKRLQSSGTICWWKYAPSLKVEGLSLVVHKKKVVYE